MQRKDEVWKTESLSQTFLKGVRGGIPFAAEQIDIMLRLIEAGGKPIERFVDLGCGNGILAGAILKNYPQALGTLVDFSEPMIKEAKSQLSKYASNLNFVVSDFGLKEWQDPVRKHAAFDVIVSGYAIHHQPDERKRELYGEIFDLLEPGGLFVNIEHVASRTGWIESIHDGCFIDHLYTFHTSQGSNKSREQIANEYVHRPDKDANILALVEPQCEWLREFGFEDVDCYFKVFEFAVFGGRRPMR